MKPSVSADVEKACKDFAQVVRSFIPVDCGFIFVVFRKEERGTALISNLEEASLMAKLRELSEQKGPSRVEDITRSQPS